MHRSSDPHCLLTVMVGGALTVPTARSRVAGRRRQPGLRGRRQRGRPVRERLRRARQSRIGRRRRRRLDDPVRLRHRARAGGATALSGSISPWYGITSASSSSRPAAGGGAADARSHPARRTSAVLGGLEGRRRVRSTTSPGALRRRCSCASAVSLLDLVGKKDRSAVDNEGSAAADAVAPTRPLRHARPMAVLDTADKRCGLLLGGADARNSSSAAHRVRHHAAPGTGVSRRVRRSTWTSSRSFLDRPRASERQVRERDDGSTPAPVSEEGDGGEQRQRRVLAHRPYARRSPPVVSAARHRGNRAGRWPDRRGTFRGAGRADPTSSSARRPSGRAGAGDVWNTRLGFASPGGGTTTSPSRAQGR